MSERSMGNEATNEPWGSTADGVGAMLTALSLVRSFGRPRPGWLRMFRISGRLTTRAMGKKVGMCHQQVRQFERGELNGTISLNSMRKMAEALECDFTYGLVPKDVHAWVKRASGPKRAKPTR